MTDRSDERSGFVYFAGAGERVKIGYTSNWRDRLRTLQTSVPTHIAPFVVIKGGRDRERELHHRFAHLRHFGEWFEAAPEIYAFIRTIPEGERVR